MKDRVKTATHFLHGGRNNGGGQARRRICFDFNSGNCTYGHRCRFDHRCSFCNKFGHGAFNCRRAAAKGNKNKNHGAGGSGGNDNKDHTFKDLKENADRNLNSN